MLTYTRYLTNVEKKQILAELEEEIREGRIDAGLEEFLHALNKIDGVVTTQSCTGHADELGYISIRLSERMHELLLRNLDSFYNDRFPSRCIVIRQEFEPYQDIMTKRVIARPRWIFWFDATDYDGFMKALITLLQKISTVLNDHA